MKRPEDPRQLYGLGGFLAVGGVLSLGLNLPPSNKVMSVLLALVGVAIIIRGIVVAIARKRNSHGEAKAEVQAKTFD